MNDSPGPSQSRRSSPIKRIRQACVNCRRKKSRCGGEKPVCSICKRLDQVCVYDSPRNRDHGAARKITAANGEEVRKAVPAATASQAFSPGAEDSDYQHPDPVIPAKSLEFPVNSARSEVLRVPRHVTETSPEDVLVEFGLDSMSQDVIQDGLETYFNSFHGQPYALFVQPVDYSSLGTVIVNPMLALSIRCSSHHFWSKDSVLRNAIQALSESSWKHLIGLYGEGATDLEYLQGLCLLAQVDFADGRVRRAQTQISLGIRITQSLGYLKSVDLGEAYRRCVWTLFMLDRTFSITRAVTPALHFDQFQLPFPASDERFLKPRQIAQVDNDFDGDIGIGAINVKVFSLWNDVLQYVFRSPPKSLAPPWQADSDLADIESQFTDFEPDFAAHRYHRVRFPRRAQDEPTTRPYFTAWLCFQLLYMSIQCVVHHPFIMFIKMQPLIRNRKVPPSFLQKSYKSSLIHSRWVIRLIEEMEDAGLMLYDPFIGYLVALAATIQLEHTVSKHFDVAAAATLSVKGAIRYLRRLSKYWKSTENLLLIVEELAARLRNRSTIYYSQDDYNAILPDIVRVSLASDDIHLMWSLFDYASISVLGAMSKSPGISTPGEIARNKIQDPSRQQISSEQLSAVNLNDDFSKIPPSSEPPHPPDGPSLGAESTLFDPAAFSDLPEEWILDDWTLFGAPLSAYHSGLES
ncbi:putative transcriptional regulatory [Hyphodiscus hymeniophilus]|uniref:Transcriptional regulatory n=1 Tax=Hyphodiscus hymeniophilus TaxID=353542 RepID=A0A9P6VIR6_9HELO|nr:putative transcriptional regulatory [Hyphodiscus hymeniophilus]